MGDGGTAGRGGSGAAVAGVDGGAAAETAAGAATSGGPAAGGSTARAVRRTGPQRLPRYIKPLIWAAALTPALILLIRFFLDDLTANPIELITNWTGYTTLCLLTASLAVTPLRRLTGYNPLIKLRRLIGLFAFFYACLHFLTYIVLDQFFAFSYIVEDILERPYITVGFTAFVLLIPLAVTSTKGWIRRLGRRWTHLHRLIYVIVPLGVLHFYWKVASKVTGQDVWIFAALVALLLAMRLPFFPWPRRRTRAG